jgi:hypothetical protein
MARVRRTTCQCKDAPAQEGEGATMERGASDESHDNAGSVERSGSVHMSDAGSQSNAEGSFNEGS